jgi:serine/threonine protein kinase
MAPEVLEGSNTYSFPVDVYSFGIILWFVTILIICVCIASCAFVSRLTPCSCALSGLRREFYAQAAPYTEVRSVLRLPQVHRISSPCGAHVCACGR